MKRDFCINKPNNLNELEMCPKIPLTLLDTTGGSVLLFFLEKDSLFILSINFKSVNNSKTNIMHKKRNLL